MSLAAALALNSRRAMPVAQLTGMRTTWGEAQFRRQLAESNDDPIPACVALCMRIPSRATCEIAPYLSLLHDQAESVSALIAPDRAPQIVWLDIAEPSAVSGSQIAALVDHLRMIFAHHDEGRCARFAVMPAHDVTIEVIESLIDGGFTGFVLRPDQCAGPHAEGERCGVRRIRGLSAAADALELTVQIPLAERSLSPAGLVGMVYQTCAGQADRIVFVPPVTANWKWAGGSRQAMLEAYAQAYAQASRRLTAAGFTRHSPIEFARGERPDSVALLSPAPQELPWGPSHRHMAVGLGLDAQSYINEWMFANETAVQDFQDSLGRGGLGVGHGTFITAGERLRLAIIYDVLIRGGIDLDILCRRHGVCIDRAVLEGSAAVRDLCRRGLVVELSDEVIRFAPHAILHAAEICGALGCPVGTVH